VCACVCVLLQDNNLFVVQVLNGIGDYIDLRHVLFPYLRPDFRGMSLDQIRQYVAVNGHCSALIKVLYVFAVMSVPCRGACSECSWLLLLLLVRHLFNGLPSRTSWVSRCQKFRASLDLNEARDDVVWGRQWHQLDHAQAISTSLQTDSHTNTPSLNFYRPDALPDTQATEGIQRMFINKCIGI